MSYTRVKTVDFGTAKTGLSTVGYTLTGGSRLATGVAEIAAGTGIFAATITFADGFDGAILWDTGEGSPAYAVDEVHLQRLDTAQTVPTSNTAQTVGDALNAARAQGFGMWTLVGTTLTLYAGDGATVVRTFTLDSATAPTSRT